MLGETQRKTLFHFLDSLSLLLSESIKKSCMRDIESRLHHSLALMERDFPMTLQVMCGYHYCIVTDVVVICTQVITMHILHHIPQGISRFGPVYGTWMWQYERFNSWICRRVLNRRHPEATVMETYRVIYIVTFHAVSRYYVYQVKHAC